MRPFSPEARYPFVLHRYCPLIRNLLSCQALNATHQSMIAKKPSNFPPPPVADILPEFSQLLIYKGYSQLFSHQRPLSPTPELLARPRGPSSYFIICYSIPQIREWVHVIIVGRCRLLSASVDRSMASPVGAILNALHYNSPSSQEQSSTTEIGGSSRHPALPRGRDSDSSPLHAPPGAWSHHDRRKRERRA